MPSYLLECIHPVLHSSALYIAKLWFYLKPHCIVVLFIGWLTVPRNSLEKSTTPLPSIICILALKSNTLYSILFQEPPEQETAGEELHGQIEGISGWGR